MFCSFQYIVVDFGSQMNIRFDDINYKRFECASYCKHNFSVPKWCSFWVHLVLISFWRQKSCYKKEAQCRAQIERILFHCLSILNISFFLLKIKIRFRDGTKRTVEYVNILYFVSILLEFFFIIFNLILFDSLNFCFYFLSVYFHCCISFFSSRIEGMFDLIK